MFGRSAAFLALATVASSKVRRRPPPAAAPGRRTPRCAASTIARCPRRV